MVHLPKLRNHLWYITINSSPDFICILPVFPPMSFFFFPGSHIAFSWLVLFGSSGLCQFVSLSMFFMILTVCVAQVRYFVGCTSTGICLGFFSWLDWSYGFWWGRPQEEKCPPHHITSECILLTWLLIDDVNFGHLAEAVFARFLWKLDFTKKTHPECGQKRKY